MLPEGRPPAPLALAQGCASSCLFPPGGSWVWGERRCERGGIGERLRGGPALRWSGARACSGWGEGRGCPRARCLPAECRKLSEAQPRSRRRKRPPRHRGRDRDRVHRRADPSRHSLFRADPRRSGNRAAPGDVGLPGDAKASASRRAGVGRGRQLAPVRSRRASVAVPGETSIGGLDPGELFGVPVAAVLGSGLGLQAAKASPAVLSTMTCAVN
jgi:hypothetical protein